MLAYKQSTVDTNTKGIEFLFKKNKIDWLKGWGSIPAVGKVKVGDEVHDAKNIIVATGSVSRKRIYYDRWSARNTHWSQRRKTPMTFQRFQD